MLSRHMSRPTASRQAPRRVRLAVARRVPIVAALAVAIISQAPHTRTAQAAAVDPLPAVARALAGVTSYQVVVTSSASGSGRPPRQGNNRGSGRGGRRGLGLGFGPGTRTETIVAVRKGSAFEDDVVTRGKDTSGKMVTREIVIYGSSVCTRASGASSYTCRQAQQSFNPDPTLAFEQGTGSATFTPTRATRIGGQTCDGYNYMNKLRNGTASGVVYISSRTNLPCEQVATTTRRAFSGGGTFTQRSTMVWSRFNDHGLKVPAISTQ